MTFLSDVLTSGVLALPLIGVYILFAVGIVVIYRASRVLNLAHGALALVPAYVFYSLGKHGMPLVVAAACGVAGGAFLGLVTERVVVRRLRTQGPVAQTVGTVAVYGFVLAMVVKLYGSAPLLPPRLFSAGIITVGTGALRIASLWMFVIGAAVTVLCLLLFRFTDLGLAMRAAADNRRAASLMGVDPDRTTAAAWAIGGGLAGLAGVLVGTAGTIDAFTLGLQVLPAFVAALIGGLDSLGGALLGCAIVALVESEITAVATLPGLGLLGTTPGTPQLVLMIVAFVVLALRGQRLVAAQGRDTGLAVVSRRARRPRAAPSPARRTLALLAVLGLVLFPYLPFVPFSIVGDAILAGYYLLAALSVVMLTGWVGQISLAQASLVGVGAFTTALAINHGNLPFPFSTVVAAVVAGGVAGVLGMVALRVRGLYLAVATLVFAWMADVYLFDQSWLGIVGGSAQANPPNIGTPGTLPYFDFTSRTLVYLVVLAVAALVVYSLANLAESKTGRALFALRGSEVAAASLGIDVTRYKLFGFVASGVIAGMAGSLVLINQRTVEPAQFSITASLFFLGIAVVGGIDSLSGAVLAATLFATLSEVFFRVQALAGLLDIVSSGLLLGVLLLYPGGLASLLQGVADGWARMASQRRRLTVASQAAVGPLLAAITQTGRRGTAVVARAGGAVAARAPRRSDTAGTSDHAPRRSRVAWVSKWIVPSPVSDRPRPQPAATDALTRLRQSAEPENGGDPRLVLVGRRDGADTPALPVPIDAPPTLESVLRGRRIATSRTAAPEHRLSTAAVLRTREVSVRFGGLLAVDGACLEVRRGEIVGLIGPNGAGKTTLFNVISGIIIPTSGGVDIFETEATALDVHQRARLGVGRTFQVIQLYPQLTVFENLLVATHIRNPSGPLGHCFALPGAITVEVAMRRRVGEVLDFLELSAIADRPIADLPFGVLRMVELARALVTGSELLLLDEPASGLDTAESERFVELLLYVREQLGLSMLLIEHDIATVMGVSDYMYVLDFGRIIAHGLPRFVQQDPAVIEAYLGQPVAVGSA